VCSERDLPGKGSRIAPPFAGEIYQARGPGSHLRVQREGSTRQGAQNRASVCGRDLPGKGPRIAPRLPRQHMLKHFKGGEGKGEFPEAFNQIGMHTDVVSRQRSSSPWETPSSLIPLVH
jgi:hypothetical protein